MDWKCLIKRLSIVLTSKRKIHSQVCSLLRSPFVPDANHALTANAFFLSLNLYRMIALLAYWWKQWRKHIQSCHSIVYRAARRLPESIEKELEESRAMFSCHWFLLRQITFHSGLYLFEINQTKEINLMSFHFFFPRSFSIVGPLWRNSTVVWLSAYFFSILGHRSWGYGKWFASEARGE